MFKKYNSAFRSMEYRSESGFEKEIKESEALGEKKEGLLSIIGNCVLFSLPVTIPLAVGIGAGLANQYLGYTLEGCQNDSPLVSGLKAGGITLLSELALGMFLMLDYASNHGGYEAL